MLLYIFPGALLLLIIVLLVNTGRHTARARKLHPPAPSVNQMPDITGLQKMLQCETVSSENSYENEEFSKLRRVMEETFPLVHRHAQRMIFSDDCWIYKLPGKDQRRNIMLMSHHDVVAGGDDWQHPAFGAEIADGKLWARGSVDTKTPLFAQFHALETLLASGFVPECNVYIGSSHNEEISGDGIPKALAYFQKQGIAFEVILDEGGAVIEPPLSGMACDKCAMVAIHEKGRYYIQCTASATGGHGSLTAATQATPSERMAGFIHEISSKNHFVRRLNPQVRAMFETLAPYCSLPMRILFSNLWLFGGLLKNVIPKLNPQAGSMLGTTCTFNKLQTTADKSCTATAFLRNVDEVDFQRDLETMRNISKKYGIELEIDKKSEYHGPADLQQPGYAYTMECIGKVFPQYPGIPFILPAGTDARHFTDICPCVLRFAPIHLSAQQLASVHNKDENLDLDAIPPAIDFYQLFLKNYK